MTKTEKVIARGHTEKSLALKLNRRLTDLMGMSGLMAMSPFFSSHFFCETIVQLLRGTA
jgi:hypothetical protein